MGNSQSSSSSHSPSSGRSRSHTTTSTSSTQLLQQQLHTQQQQQHTQLSDRVIDLGTVEPQNFTYASAPHEYSRSTVHRLIQDRRLAPFYLGLNDYEEDWQLEDIVEALLEAEQQAGRNLSDAHEQAIQAASEAEATQLTIPPGTRKSKEGAQAVATAQLHRERLREVIRHRDRKVQASVTASGTPANASKRELAKLYLGQAIECPICFL